MLNQGAENATLGFLNAGLGGHPEWRATLESKIRHSTFLCPVRFDAAVSA